MKTIFNFQIDDPTRLPNFDDNKFCLTIADSFCPELIPYCCDQLIRCALDHVKPEQREQMEMCFYRGIEMLQLEESKKHTYDTPLDFPL